MAIFHEQLHSRYDGPSTSHFTAKALELDQEICNEDTLQLSLHRFLIPVVNHCLDNLPSKPHYGPGTRCTAQDSKVKPDWSLICMNTYINFVPGDTKLSTKFWPSMVATELVEWQKVIGQVAMYQKTFGSRYGFIITDDVLVVMRLTREHVGPGLAPNRGMRGVVASPDRYADFGSIADTSIADTSIADTSFANTTASFVDDEATNWEMNMPEYATIPGKAHGPNQLTVKLALWCLAMMAVNGGNEIQASYPALNSWRYDGRCYFHNSSGKSKSRLAPGDIVQASDPGISDIFIHGEAANELGAGDGGFGPLNEKSEVEDSGHGEGESSQGIVSNDAEIEDELGVADTASVDGVADVEANVLDDQGSDGGGAADRSDTETITAGLRRMSVTIKKHTFSRRPYYVDARGREMDTDISEWTRVGRHYELHKRRHIYVTKAFP